MKNSYLHAIILFILATIFLYSCNNDKRVVKRLFKERAFLLKEFKDKSVIWRGNIFCQLSYYNGQFTNTFYFERRGNNLVFTNDTLQYPISDVPAFASLEVADTLGYRYGLTTELNRLLKVMDSFSIRHVSAEERYAGINMKFLFGDFKALLYVSNIAGIKNARWKAYVASGEKLDENWYYVTE